jgi:hypothetical protein
MGTDHKHAKDGEHRNEGEGNRTAAKAYNRDTRDFIESGQVDTKAREAREAIDGAEAGTLEDAEKVGKSHSHGEDPAVKR